MYVHTHTHVCIMNVVVALYNTKVGYAMLASNHRSLRPAQARIHFQWSRPGAHLSNGDYESTICGGAGSEALDAVDMFIDILL